MPFSFNRTFHTPVFFRIGIVHSFTHQLGISFYFSLMLLQMQINFIWNLGFILEFLCICINHMKMFALKSIACTFRYWFHVSKWHFFHPIHFFCWFTLAIFYFSCMNTKSSIQKYCIVQLSEKKKFHFYNILFVIKYAMEKKWRIF